MNKKILVVAAHPDDEILGCGATMAKYIKAGHEVHVIILAEGLTSRDAIRDRDKKAEELSTLAKVSYKANQLIGVSSLTLHDFPDNRMDSIDLLDIVKTVEKHIDLIKPDVIYTHHAGDVNIDHRCLHNAVITACRPFPGNLVNTLLFFEVPSNTEWAPPYSLTPFVPNWFTDISEFLEVKIRALEIYQSEMRPWPHARSLKAIEHLAYWRGSNIGVNAAEAFMTGRNIVL